MGLRRLLPCGGVIGERCRKMDLVDILDYLSRVKPRLVVNFRSFLSASFLPYCDPFVILFVDRKSPTWFPKRSILSIGARILFLRFAI